MFLIVGEGSSNRNASRDESVEAGDKSVEAGMNLSKPGKKHRNHVIIAAKTYVSCAWHVLYGTYVCQV